MLPRGIRARTLVARSLELRSFGAWATEVVTTLVARALRTAAIHRRVLAGVMTRLAWWGSLPLLLWGAQRLFDAPRYDSVQEPEFLAFIAFAIGFGTSATSALLAPQRRVRLMALGMAATHGGLALLAWWVMHP